MKSLFYRLTILLHLLLYHACGHKVAYHDGDIIFQTSRSGQSRAIQLATHSRYSHMGMVFLEDGKPMVLEAVQPVKWTPLANWIARGEGGHYVVKRLRGYPGGLSQGQIMAMQKVGRGFLHKDYDLKFEWSDDRIYCSELVWKIYHRALNIDIGKLRPLKTFDLSSPEVQAKIRERFGPHKWNPDEPMISPDEMFRSALLTEVQSN